MFRRTLDERSERGDGNCFLAGNTYTFGKTKRFYPDMWTEALVEPIDTRRLHRHTSFLLVPFVGQR